VLLGRGLCDELITRPEEYYRLWCVVGCDLETSQRRPWPTQGCRADDDDDNNSVVSLMKYNPNLNYLLTIQTGSTTHVPELNPSLTSSTLAKLRL
jgi:hypothetical protein